MMLCALNLKFDSYKILSNQLMKKYLKTISTMTRKLKIIGTNFIDEKWESEEQAYAPPRHALTSTNVDEQQVQVGICSRDSWERIMLNISHNKKSLLKQVALMNLLTLSTITSRSFPKRKE